MKRLGCNVYLCRRSAAAFRVLLRNHFCHSFLASHLLLLLSLPFFLLLRFFYFAGMAVVTKKQPTHEKLETYHKNTQKRVGDQDLPTQKKKNKK